MAAKKVDQTIEADESVALSQVETFQQECSDATMIAATSGVDDFDQELAPWLKKNS